MRFHFVMAVWGASYIDAMTAVTIPSLLWPGNIPAVARRHECRFVIYCRASEVGPITGCSIVQRLAEVIPVECIPFEPDASPNHYEAMTVAHGRAFSAAAAGGAHGVTLCPDGVFANGSIGKAAEIAEAGKVAVMTPGPRILQESAEPALRQREGPLSPRDLARICLDHMHPEQRRYFVHSQNFSQFPSTVCWSLGSKGFMIRAFHLHPLIVDFSRIGPAAFKGETIDGALLNAVKDASWIHVETDSDNILVCSMTPAAAWYSESKGEPFHLDALRRASRHPLIGPVHRNYFRHPIRVHTGEIDAAWSTLEAETSWLADLVSTSPRKRMLGWLAQRRARQGRYDRDRQGFTRTAQSSR